MNMINTSGRMLKALAAALALVMALSVLLLLPGCTQGKQGAAPAGQAADYTFTDDMGNTVTVESCDAVVACMGSFANCWELAGGTLAGASSDAFESYGIGQDVANVGDFTALNLEAIMALDPDFVILTAGTGGRGEDSSQAQVQAQLAEAGIPAALFKVSTFEDYQRMMEIFCAITGDQEAYERNVGSVASSIESIVANVPAREQAPTALLAITYSGGIRAQAETTQTGAMLQQLGVENIAVQNRSLLSDFQMEALLQADPDYIFLISMGNTQEDADKAYKALVADNPAWQELSAVKSGNCIMLPAEGFLYKPNEKWAESYQTLFDYLYK